ncbi:hypothetical protein PT2222_180122 [Paraburkholderia tropica]
MYKKLLSGSLSIQICFFPIHYKPELSSFK